MNQNNKQSPTAIPANLQDYFVTVEDVENFEKSNPLQSKDASLDNKTTNCVSSKSTIQDFPPGQRVQFNNKYCAKISSKATQSFNIRRAIANHLSQGVADPHTGEFIQEDLQDLDRGEAKGIFTGTYFENLYQYYYRLGLNDSLYAEFDNGLGLKTTQIIATKYSMHNLCPVWGYRKSQVIRKRYKEYFTAHPDLLTNYHPCHMVLTLRHNAQGYYLGDNFIPQRFFARDLIEQFKQFRDNHRKVWKEFVYGGCYNIEVKRSKKDVNGNDNGIHIHMHCLVLQNKSHTVNQVRDWIKTNWELQTGASKIHYETLYYYDPEQKRTIDDFSTIEEVYDEELGTYEYLPVGTTKIINPLSETYEYGFPTIEAPAKQYYDDSWTIDQTTRAILEALKYNFKADALVDENGEYDIPFIAEVLNHSKRLRFTSRFNAFYRVPELNFTELSADEAPQLEDTNDHLLANYITTKADEYDMSPDELSMESFYYPHLDHRAAQGLGYSQDYETFIQRLPEIIDIVKNQRAKSILDLTDIEKHYGSLINPFTHEEASYEDFNIVLGFPHTVRHHPRTHHQPNAPRHNPANYYQVAQEASSIKELTRVLMMSHYDRILAYEDLDRFNQSYHHLQQLRL